MTQNCNTSSARQISQGLINPEFVTVQLQQGNNLNNVDRDIAVQFQRPHKFFMIVAIANTFAGSDVFMHFTKLGYPVVNGSNQISPTGQEQWIPIANIGNNAGRCEGRWIKLNTPISLFYIDADHRGVNSATPYYITFMGCDEIEDVISERQ